MDSGNQPCSNIATDIVWPEKQHLDLRDLSNIAKPQKLSATQFNKSFVLTCDCAMEGERETHC
jgi:hypothetical protein